MKQKIKILLLSTLTSLFLPVVAFADAMPPLPPDQIPPQYYSPEVYICLNFLINTIIIICIYLILRLNIKKLIKLKPILQIIGLTILGFAIDFLAYLPTTTTECYLNDKSEYNYQCDDHDFSSPDFSPFRGSSGYAIMAYLLLVTVGVTVVFYFLFSKNLSIDKWKRLKYSLIFGLLSNPVWYIIFYRII